MARPARPRHERAGWVATRFSDKAPPVWRRRSQLLPRASPGHLDFTRALGALPVQADAEERADRGLDHHQIHELAIDELLKRHRPERPGRLLIKAEGVERKHELQSVEPAPVGEHRQRAEEKEAVERE